MPKSKVRSNRKSQQYQGSNRHGEKLTRTDMARKTQYFNECVEKFTKEGTDNVDPECLSATALEAYNLVNNKKD